MRAACIATLHYIRIYILLLFAQREWTGGGEGGMGGRGGLGLECVCVWPYARRTVDRLSSSCVYRAIPVRWRISVRIVCKNVSSSHSHNIIITRVSDVSYRVIYVIIVISANNMYYKYRDVRSRRGRFGHDRWQSYVVVVVVERSNEGSDIVGFKKFRDKDEDFFTHPMNIIMTVCYVYTMR